MAEPPPGYRVHRWILVASLVLGAVLWILA